MINEPGLALTETELTGIEQQSRSLAEDEIQNILAKFSDNPQITYDYVVAILKEDLTKLISLYPSLFHVDRVFQLVKNQVATRSFDVETGLGMLLHLIKSGKEPEINALIEKMDIESKDRLSIKINQHRRATLNLDAENNGGNIAGATKIKDPREDLPEVSSEAELAKLQTTSSESGQNEVQRSNFYRTRGQVKYLREILQSLPHDQLVEILNVGPANLEEAVMYASAAQSTGKINSTSITFVDVQPVENIHPKFDLGKNILTAPIEPDPEDQQNFHLTAEGTFEANAEIQDFIASQVTKPDNHFSSAVEAFLNESNDTQYNVVTFNNVAQYLGRGSVNYDNPIYQREGDFSQFQAVLLTLANKVAVGGLLFTQVTGGASRSQIDAGAVHRQLTTNTNFTQIFEVVDEKQGIYRKFGAGPVGVINDSEMNSATKSEPRQISEAVSNGLAEQIAVFEGKHYKFKTKDEKNFVTNKLNGCVVIFEITDDANGDREVIFTHYPQMADARNSRVLHELTTESMKKAPRKHVLLLGQRKRAQVQKFKSAVNGTLGTEYQYHETFYTNDQQAESDGVLLVTVSEKSLKYRTWETSEEIPLS